MQQALGVEMSRADPGATGRRLPIPVRKNSPSISAASFTPNFDSSGGISILIERLVYVENELAVEGEAFSVVARCSFHFVALLTAFDTVAAYIRRSLCPAAAATSSLLNPSSTGLLY